MDNLPAPEQRPDPEPQVPAEPPSAPVPLPPALRLPAVSPMPPVGPQPGIPAAPPPPPSDGTLGGLIPYKNSSALIAYYLGVFSLIPCFGPFLGLPALVFGFIGLNYYHKNPEAKGKVHALVGIIIGGLWGLVCVGFVLWILFNMIKR